MGDRFDDKRSRDIDDFDWENPYQTDYNYTRGYYNRGANYNRDYNRDYYDRGYGRGYENRGFYDRQYDRGTYDRDIDRDENRGFFSPGFDQDRNDLENRGYGYSYTRGYYNRNFDRNRARGFYDRNLDRGYTSGFFDQDMERESGRGYLNRQRDYGNRFNRAFDQDWYSPGPFTGIGPRGYRRSDERILEDVYERLTKHGQIDSSGIDIEVNLGEVTLNGIVDRKREKRLAEDIAYSVNGVVDVHNRLRVRASGGVRVRGMGREDVVMPGRIQEGMQVVGANSEEIGRVKESRNNDFLLERKNGDAFYVPFSAVKRTNGEIMLKISADEINQQNWKTPQMVRSAEMPGE